MVATQRCLPTGLLAVERLIQCRFDKTKENKISALISVCLPRNQDKEKKL